MLTSVESNPSKVTILREGFFYLHMSSVHLGKIYPQLIKKNMDRNLENKVLINPIKEKVIFTYKGFTFSID